MEIRIAVVAHKPYRMPGDSMYVPLMVGELQEAPSGWRHDAEGENIASKNPFYCELTGLYWVWKHLDADALGIVHYRRHFSQTGPGFADWLRDAAAMEKGEGIWNRILTATEAEALLEKAPVVLPKARNYYIESVGSQYAHAHGQADLDRLRGVIGERSPQSLSAWERVLSRRHIHLFNMFLMRREMFCAYCAWLFDLLFALEERLNADTVHARMFGYLAERLLDVWLIAHGIPFVETPVLFMERRNWLEKGWNFLARRLRGHGGVSRTAAT